MFAVSVTFWGLHAKPRPKGEESKVRVTTPVKFARLVRVTVDTLWEPTRT